ncbi:hypothetical protein [Serpentinimonas barnesii]|uniref:hypothetical protein n=1 Tax=Serpentinimonas barnesii TaxID=1458427 RepID=UPI0009717166|nr:hypothetical protein [Serpentinimonas barnesii]
MSSLKEQLSASVRSSGSGPTGVAGTPRPAVRRTRAAAPTAAAAAVAPTAVLAPPGAAAPSIASPSATTPASRLASEPKPSARELFPSRVWPD